MAEPDELYTLRAQFWLGHHLMCIDEAKAVARRPMSPELKQEREEFLARAHLALGHYDKVTGPAADGATPALQAIALRAQYDLAGDNELQQTSVVDQVKALVASEPNSTSVQLTAAQVFLQHGLTKEALQCVHLGSTMEHILLSLQVYLKMDRLDLATQSLQLLKQADEDAILTQLGSVYVVLATGSSASSDAIHILQSLAEQYGPSPYLLNLMAVSYLTSGDYDKAEQRLEECRREFPDAIQADTLINLIVCYQQQGKSWKDILQMLKEGFPKHAFCQGVDRVEGALDRDAVKYKV